MKGLRFRKSFKVAPGVRVNVGKGSVGVSAGVKGARVSTNTRTGTRGSVGVPGTGVRYEKRLSASKGQPTAPRSSVGAGRILFGLALLLIIGFSIWSIARADTVPLPEYGCVDLNIASFEELRLILHIDEVRAEQIIELRDTRPFASVEEMTRINGIGPARIRDILEQDVACVLEWD